MWNGKRITSSGVKCKKEKLKSGEVSRRRRSKGGDQHEEEAEKKKAWICEMVREYWSDMQN